MTERNKLEAFMPNVSLMSFLKILGKGTPQKVQEYGKYLKPGGYQFYWRLHESARLLTIEQKAFAECLKHIELATNEVERECNGAAFKALGKWTDKYPVDAYFPAPTATCTSPGGYITLKLEPEFGMSPPGQPKRIIQLWYSKNNTLSRNSVLLGTHLMQKHLCVGEFADCKPGILDLRKKHLHILEVSSPQIMDTMVATEFAWVDSFFKSQEDATKAA
jgi:hypothetical protein